MISWNLHRRQLSTSQRATVALSLKPMFEAKAKERQKEAGGDRKSEESKNEKPLSANSPEAIDSRKQASKAVNVGERIVQDAQFVRDHDPVAFEEVKAGKIDRPQRTYDTPSPLGGSGKGMVWSTSRPLE